MTVKTKQIEEYFTECDWCGKEILDTEKTIFISSADKSRNDHFHEDCLVQVVFAGVDGRVQ